MSDVNAGYSPLPIANGGVQVAPMFTGLPAEEAKYAREQMMLHNSERNSGGVPNRTLFHTYAREESDLESEDDSPRGAGPDQPAASSAVGFSQTEADSTQPLFEMTDFGAS